MYKLLALLICIPSLYAQTMNVMLTSGNAVSADLDDITRITFTTDMMNITTATGTAGAALDSITRVTFDSAAVSGITDPGTAGTPLVTGVRVHPNPVFSSTAVGIVLQRAGHITVSVYPQNGAAPVAVVYDGYAAAGTRSFAWSGNDTDGRPVPNGSYIIMVQGASGRTAIKTLVIR